MHRQRITQQRLANKMAKIMEKLRLGYCCYCDRKILDLSKRNPIERKLPDYKEHFLKLNDNSLMKIAACKDCDKKMDSDMADFIMKRHYKTWENEIKSSEV